MIDNANLANDSKRLRFLAQNYNCLRGWSTCLGLMFIVWGIARWFGGLSATNLIMGWLFLPSLALLALVTWTLERYYERHFGTVKEASPPKRLLAVAVAVFIFVGISRLVGPDYKNLKLACDPTVLSAGVFMILFGLLPTFPWRHYALVGLVLLGVGFLPAMHLLNIEQFRHGWDCFAVGIGWLVCGAIDHLILMRSFSPIQADAGHV